MKKVVLFSLLIVFCINLFALREVSIGDSFKKTPLNEKILINKKKIIVFLNGNKKKNEKMLKVLNNVLESDAPQLNVFFIKTMNVNYEMLKKIAENKKQFVIIDDFERKLYGEFGIIVLPTVLFVNEQQVLIGEIAGVIPNMRLVFKSYLKALKTGEPPADIYEKIKKQKVKAKKEKSIRQAFLMFVNGNYQVSLSIFKRLYEKFPDDKRVVLGYAYSLMFSGKPDEGKKIIEKAKVNSSNKRFELAYCYASFLEGGTMEQLKECAQNANFEPDFFSVIFQIGKDFEKNGMCEEALKCYKEAYKVLWKRYRRGK